MRDLQLAGAWLARHGLVDTGPTPELAARLRARMLARLAFAAATATGVLVLTLSAFAVDDPAVRRAAVVLLVGVCGVVAGTAIQIRHLLTRPVVAEDEDAINARAPRVGVTARQAAAR